MRPERLAFLVILVGLVFCFEASAQSSKRIRFARGATSATVSGTVKGYQYVDYVVGVANNQRLSVKLTGSSNAELVVFAPNGDNVEGAFGVDWDGVVSPGGNYRIRVLMPRAIARRKGSTASYKLHVKIVD